MRLRGFVWTRLRSECLLGRSRSLVAYFGTPLKRGYRPRLLLPGRDSTFRQGTLKHEQGRRAVSTQTISRVGGDTFGVGGYI